jgi:hypothetical protein
VASSAVVVVAKAALVVVSSTASVDPVVLLPHAEATNTRVRIKVTMFFFIKRT